MNTITLTLDLDTTPPETLAAVVSLLKGEQPAAPAVPEGPKKATKVTKTEAAKPETVKAEEVKAEEPAPAATVAAPAATVAAPAATVAAPATTNDAQGERLTIEKVRAVMAPYATGQVPGGKELLREALGHFGAQKLTELAADKYQDFLDHLDNLANAKKTAA